MRKRLGVGLVILVAAALAAAAVAQSRSTAGTINIGWVGDKSGPTASSQLPSLHGIETAVKYVNTHGGVNGNQINLIEKDDTYNPTTELTLVKSLIQDDHVPVIMGLGQSTGYASVVPILDQAHTIGLSTQSALKLTSDPFNPYLFAGTASYADQVDVGIAYEMKRLRLKTLKGVSVGVAAIQAASGQEVIDEVTKVVHNLGGNVVAENLPSALINADVQVQDLQSKNVKFLVVHHSVSGSVVFLRSVDKFNLDIPIVGMQGITEAVVFKTAPYNVTKNTVGMDPFNAPYLAKTPAAKLIATLGQQYGYAADELTEANFTGGWVDGMLVAQALKNANGDYTGGGVKKGFEKIKNFDPAGGMTPLLSYGPLCHIAWPNPRPYLYNYTKQQFQPAGTWQQWAKYDTKPYAPAGTCGVPRGTTK
jgi:ABC-type branched-subunit amino acid transport system substrate-binding protein